MHFSVSWDISAPQPRWSAINDQLFAVISGYAHLRPVNTFYIVRVASQAEWDAVRLGLTNVALATTDATIHFVMTPLIQGGRYDGRLPTTTWPEINRLTE